MTRTMPIALTIMIANPKTHDMLVEIRKKCHLTGRNLANLTQ
ncbi:hypothetical protein AB3K25_06095 [Leuconostoc sp. MS02]|uniref:Uncharacterized protein n=1 Tax=Leuconostoc aquikimchii TaxID=3236804 RepID=A0ABV3S240_9LACO